MKTSNVKAFTLVEMLIVIVIIGILIASLMPRMQSAQWRARDVARKNDLAQIQTAIITSQQDKWKYPGMWTDAKIFAYDANGVLATTESSSTDAAVNWLAVAQIAGYLKTAWMTNVPVDPNGSNTFYWVWTSKSKPGEYSYIVTNRNSVNNAWFALMAKTEVEWWSNWIVCWEPVDSTDKATLKTNLQTKWFIVKWVDLKDVVTCSSFTKDTSASATCWMSNWACTYTDDAQLRYILVY